MRVPVADAVAELEASGLRGRGGAGFPFSRKLATAARRGATVVVTLSEGEPASLKDAVLALTRPHLILDGAAASALTVGAKQVHVVLPGEHPEVADAIRRALAERRDRGIAWRTHVAGSRWGPGDERAAAACRLATLRRTRAVPRTAAQTDLPRRVGLSHRPRAG